MFEQERRERLRSPEERVGTLPNGALPPPRGELTDEQLLVAGLLEGDERAFALALDRLFGPMLGIAMRYVRSRAEAEEVVQDAWLAALRGIAGFERRSAVKTWLYRILENRARTRGVRSARSVAFTDLELVAGADAESMDGAWLERTLTDGHPVAGPERALLSRELRDHIDRAIEVLPERQRAVVVMRDVDGRTPADVGAALGLTDGNQRVLLHRARTRIREELAVYLDEGNGRENTIRLASG